MRSKNYEFTHRQYETKKTQIRAANLVNSLFPSQNNAITHISNYFHRNPLRFCHLVHFEWLWKRCFHCFRQLLFIIFMFQMVSLMTNIMFIELNCSGIDEYVFFSQNMIFSLSWTSSVEIEMTHDSSQTMYITHWPKNNSTTLNLSNIIHPISRNWRKWMSLLVKKLQIIRLQIISNSIWTLNQS
jgi:hypothetical protein